MSSGLSLNIFRRLLQKSLDWLDRVEKKTPRSQKSPWYRIEIHFPPIIVALVTTILLYLALYFHFNPSVIQALGLGLLVIIFVTLFSLYLAQDHPKLSQSEDAMGLLAVTFFLNLIWIITIHELAPAHTWLTPYATPLAIGPLLTTLLLHPRVAMVLAFISAMLLGIVNNFSLPVALTGMVGGLTIVAVGTKARTAHHVARAGLVAGLIQALIVLFLSLQLDWAPTTTWISLGGALASGIFAAAFSLGALPFLESFFSQTSNLRLLEMADVNHPLLKRMSIEAPGTYHHSLIVASLAENAANSIRANGLLCRVGAYFHDIGKMVKAEYFIENQGPLGNPHDRVSPSLSKLVITSHVKEGVALAKAHKLDQRIINFIPQHHGTSQIEFFYQKALQLEEKEEEHDQEDVSEETYRYPGPKPQTREAGIVMMADSVEAASRTLEEPTHQRFKDLVYKIVNKKFFDGQLDETSLTLKDLHTIAERFTSTLTSIHHSRVPYPDVGEPDKTAKKNVISPKK